MCIPRRVSIGKCTARAGACRDVTDQPRQRSGSETMTSSLLPGKPSRRSILQGGAAVAALQVASPFIIAARGETPVKIGMVDPLTGVYAALASNEVTGAKLAVTEMNAKGGILGRQVELLVEDSAND